MWAAGCLMAELMLMRPLFPGSSEADQLFRILSCIGSPGAREMAKRAAGMGMSLPSVKPLGLAEAVPSASRDALAVLDALLQVDPSRRPSASSVLSMPFFSAGRDSAIRFPENTKGAASDAAARAAATEAQATLESLIKREAAAEAAPSGPSRGGAPSSTSGLVIGGAGADPGAAKGAPAASVRGATSQAAAGTSEGKHGPRGGPGSASVARGGGESGSGAGAPRRRVATNPFDDLGADTAQATAPARGRGVDVAYRPSESKRGNSSSGSESPPLTGASSSSFGAGAIRGAGAGSGAGTAASFGGPQGGAASSNSFSSSSSASSSSAAASGTVGLGILQGASARRRGGPPARGSDMAALLGGLNLGDGTGSADGGGYVPSAATGSGRPAASGRR